MKSEKDKDMTQDRDVLIFGGAGFIGSNWAERLLATTDMKIVDIAFASGFGSASRFYSAFEALCRQSPKKYRATMLSGFE